ncbi:MAG: hypothetical protein PVJ20_03895 [Desulfobacterales bacterium]|jgi:hypothetical protein
MSSSKLGDWKITVVSIAILVMILVSPVISVTMDNIGDTEVKSDAQAKVNYPQDPLAETINLERHTPKPPSKDDGNRHQNPKEKNGKDDQDEKNGANVLPFQQKHLWLICLSGMFGGLLFGIRDKKLVIPHRKSKNIYEPGVVTDVLFGVAGGVVIFLILPGNITPEKDTISLLKFIGVALIGGYGGRALVEKVLTQQIKDLQDSVDDLKAQNKEDAAGMALINKHFDDDPDTPAVPHDTLKAAIAKASHSLQVYAFDQARTFRRKALRNVRKKHGPNHIDRVVPVFLALIDCDEKNVYHRNHGQLAFALKDQEAADWAKAKEELTIAMEIRDRNKVGGFYVYEFNRALCRIKTVDKLEEIKKDLEVALSGPKTGDWVKKPSQVCAPDLVEWLKTNRERLKDWIKERGIQIPE